MDPIIILQAGVATGTVLLFAALVLIYVFACSGLGLLISTISENQTQAFQLNMMITLMGLVVSGFIFPRTSLPLFINWLGYLFPLTYFIPIARGVMSSSAATELRIACSISLALARSSARSVSAITIISSVPRSKLNNPKATARPS